MASPRKTRKTSIFSSDGDNSCFSTSELDEQDIENLDDARKVIRHLKERCRNQSYQLLTWRRRAKQQEEKTALWEQQRSEQFKYLSTQLILFEARLIRKQRVISDLLNQRDIVIAKQQQILTTLQQRLTEAGIDCPIPDLSRFDSPTCETNLDSLNDSDSAVVLEEDSSYFRHRYGDNITIMRSISDAAEPGGKYYSLRRSNGFLRRPEVLETVYSVEEDADADAPPEENKVDELQETRQLCTTENRTPVSSKRQSWGNSGRIQALYGSFERLTSTSTPVAEEQKAPQSAQITYNRVMSNHRSVTKPKDVKYKRINKAKSKSLEELRGRLKNWVDKGNKTATVEASSA